MLHITVIKRDESPTQFSNQLHSWDGMIVCAINYNKSCISQHQRIRFTTLRTWIRILDPIDAFSKNIKLCDVRNMAICVPWAYATLCYRVFPSEVMWPRKINLSSLCVENMLYFSLNYNCSIQKRRYANICDFSTNVRSFDTRIARTPHIRHYVLLSRETRQPITVAPYGQPMTEHRLIAQDCARVKVFLHDRASIEHHEIAIHQF